MLKLKSALKKAKVSQTNLAKECGISPTAIAQLVNYGVWPKTNVKELKTKIFELLGSSCTSVFDNADGTQDRGQGANNNETSEEDIMLLRKQMLTPAAKRAFSLLRNPFDEVRCSDEVFLTPALRYVRETLRQTAKHGGFVAVVGESGSGKSTLRKDLNEWIEREKQSIIVIEPYVLGMEENDVKGKTLKSSHIAEAILSATAPGEKPKASAEARFSQVHEALRESHRAGNRHVLMIEEAHGLPIPTLKHLKRFFELEDGFSKLLGIVLIGQTELGQKLDERNPRVREVVQRCEVVFLRPLDADLGGYLQHRFKAVGKSMNEVMEANAVEALMTKLSGRGNYSVLYPLAVNNVVTAALNEAAELGLPMLSPELIEGV